MIVAFELYGPEFVAVMENGALTATVVVAAAVQPRASVAVTVYMPLATAPAFAMLGEAVVLVKALGPDHA